MIHATRVLRPFLLGMCWCAANLVRAATLDVDTVLGPDHPYPNETIAVVDGDNPPTRVDIVAGAIVGGTEFGPTVPIGLDLYGQSVATLDRGLVQGLDHAVRLNNDSTFRMIDGGVFPGGIEARDTSEVIVENGIFNGLVGRDSSVIRLNDVFPDLQFGVAVRDHARAVISNGDFSFVAEGSSTAVIRGGRFETAAANGNTHWLIAGGFFSGLAVNGGTVHLRSMDAEGFGDEDLVVSGGTAHIYGFGLRFDVDPFDGAVIVGQLSDGDPFYARYQGGGNIILHEVPEPGTFALLGLGALLLLPRCLRRAK